MNDLMTRQEFTEYMTAFEKRLDGRFQALDFRFDDLKRGMQIQFEDVRRDIRFSLEAVQGLRETTGQGFAERRTEHREQTTLLEDVLRHVRGRVERLERRPPRRTPRRKG